MHVRLLVDELVLHDLVSHEERISTIEEVNEMIDSGGAYIEQHGSIARSPVPAHFDPSNAYLISDVPDSLKSSAGIQVWLEKIKWLKRIGERGYKKIQDDKHLRMVIKEIEHEFMETCPFQGGTLYRAHLALRKHGGDYRVIFPKFSNRGGKGKNRLTEEIEAIINDVLDVASKPEFGLIQPSRIHALVEGKILQLQRAEPNERYLHPSLPTVARRMRERFSEFEIYARKYGKDRAARKYRLNSMRVTADRPLDVVEFDDKDTACFLIDDRTGLPWGRAHVTAGIDQATYAIVGINISEHARSVQSAWAAFEHSIYPKDPLNSDFAKCKQKWEPFGHIGTVVLDNATYNATTDIQASIIEYGAELQYSRPHSPTNKSCIEHWNSELINDHICHLPGWAGKKEDRDALNHGTKGAIFTITHFKQSLFRWITDIYSNKVADAIGKSPREAWSEAFAQMQPYMPKQMPQITLAGTVRQTLKVRASGGLLRKKLRYQSDQLYEMEKRVGIKTDYVVRYSPNDLSFIFVQDPRTNSYLRVPCIEDPRKYQFTSDYQQTLILKFCAAARKSGTKGIDLYEGRMALVENTRQLLASKSMRKRKTAMRAGVMDASIETHQFQSEVLQTPIEKLEKFVDEILQHEIVDDDFDIEFYQ